jgi:very-short-patch-repair endonuclease/DNA polymerase III delta prime subunit
MGIDLSDDLPEPNANEEEVPEKHRDNKLQTKLFVETLEAQLRRMSSKARTIIEETGKNQLYLVVGFLEWKERNDSSREFEAPLIMIPVELKKKERRNLKARCYEYTIQYTGEDLIPNLSLREKLVKEFDLILPNFEDEHVIVGEDGENDLDPEAYFDAVRDLVSNMEGWEVRRKIVLGFFSFSKLMMYLDLDPKRWPNGALEKNQHIHRLFGLEESSSSDGTDPIEDDPDHESFPLILDADSSQTEAIRDAMNGRNMIIQGPPGTGKSQTITNLIACFLNAGKSVLFLAEKMAALSVVHRNLEKVGLADFCLELHSHKVDKRQVRDSLRKRHNLTARNVIFTSEITQLKALKESLGKHILAVTKSAGPKGETVYEVIGKSENLRSRLTNLSGLTIQEPDSIGEMEMQETLSLLDSLSRQYKEIGKPRENIWLGFEAETLVLGDEDTVAEYIEAARAELVRILESVEKCYSALRIETDPREITAVGSDAMCRFAAHVPPPDIRYDIAAKVFQTGEKGIWEQARTFQKLIHDYQKISIVAKETFRDPTAISTDDAATLRMHLDGLLEWGITIIDKSLTGSLCKTCDRLTTLLQQCGDLVQEALPDASSDLQNVRDLDRIEAILTLFQSIPEEIGCIDISRLFSSSIRLFATELTEESDRLLREREELDSIFALNDACGIEELSTIRRVFRQKQRSFLRSLHKDYRQARNQLGAFVRDRSLFKNHALADLIERLEYFLRDEKVFRDQAAYNEIFGDMFHGLNTEWDRLRRVLGWTANLIDATRSVDEAKLLLKSLRGASQLSGFNETFIQMVTSIRKTIEMYSSQMEGLGCSQKLDDVLVRDIAPLLKELGKQRDICLSIHDSSIADMLPEKYSIHAARKAIDALIESSRLRTQLDTDQQMKSILEPHFEGANTNIDDLMNTINWALHACELNLPEELVVRLTVEDMRTAIAEISKAAEGMNQDFGLVNSNIHKLTQFGKLDMQVFCGGALENLAIGDFETKLATAVSQIDRLAKWAGYRRFVQKAVSMGLEEIVESIESEAIPAEEACDVYLHALYNGIARQQIRENTELATFTRADYEAKRARFAKLDGQMLTLYRRKIAYNACQKPVPIGRGGARVRELTDMRLLQHEFPKERRLVPVRQLMNRAGNAVRALKPVLMMSPMSVAQFLEPGRHHFDVIIMDEASQIQPHEALGAIARADQMIVVGDSKQLPPMTFFQTEMENPDDEQGEESIFDDTDAGSSILDMCDAISMPSARLKWHYRSEHESLIAFSNSLWYDNELIIFPSPGTDTSKLGIVFHYVDEATYAGGKNEREADYVARHIIAHVKRFPELSLGVGTFNLKQRDIIEDRLDHFAREDSATELALEEYRKNHKDLEPLFIKNLENLQGDERDVIFISCTFGPDKETKKISMNFGPINKANGWKRLNVLFTRAKKRIEVFSSMKAEDIRVQYGQEGLNALKKFLKYAESGILIDPGHKTGLGPDSDFEVAVAKVINNIGFQTELQVGVSGYFIDIGVCHPNRPGEFVLGVECDGAMYHSSKSARDRDRLREEVLVRRGWNIHRIWSTDWFKCRPDEIERLKNRLCELIESDKHKVVQVEDPLPSYQIVPDLEARKLSDKELRDRITLFCVENIPRSLEWQKKDGFLNEEILSALVEKRITDMDEFREHVSVFYRVNLNNDDVQYIHDIFEIIKQTVC